MKNTIYLIILLTFSSINAQIFGNDPEINIQNIAPNSTWQIIEMALIENNFAVGELKYSDGLLFSGWISWNALMINNRARLHFKQNGTTVTLKVADRNYKTDKGWSEAIGKLSKKKYKVYVQAVADKINEINSNSELIRKAVKSSKLIPAFNAINMVGDAEIKLLSSEQNENNRPVFKFIVTNTGTKTIKLAMLDGDFHNQSGVGTARSRIKWEQPDESNGNTTILQPGNKTNLEIRIGQGYYLESAIGYAMTTKWKYNKQNEYLKMKIYNIPIPYTYTEGD